MPEFISGQELSRRFYAEQVRPALAAAYPALPHSAALLGRGSEVLGFDDEMSSDHNWEPRVLIFLREDDRTRHGPAISTLLEHALPTRFHDHATGYSVTSVRSYVHEHLDLDLEDGIGPRDWLTFPEQRLRMLTAGAVFHDEVGLQAVRDRLAYYPRDVWLFLLISAWWRLHPEVNLVGRTGYVGDELGSALLASQLVHDIMQLGFLMEKQYAPYSKWFGTAFSRLHCAATLAPILSSVVRADTWSERQRGLTAAYHELAAMHNALQVTPPVRLEAQRMWDRPFPVMWGDFPGLLRAQIQDPVVQRIADDWPTGGIDQVREVLWSPRWRRRLLALLTTDTADA